nr:MAG TPA: hypothetical protein [Caudoviricetes sp.]
MRRSHLFRGIGIGIHFLLLSQLYVYIIYYF